MNGKALLTHSIAAVGLLFFGNQTAADQGWVHYKDALVKLHGGPIQGEGAKCTAWNTTNDDMQIHYKFGYFGPDPGFHTVWEADLWIEAGSLGGSASGAPPASEWTCEITFIGKSGDISATLCDDQPDNWSYFCLQLDEYLEPVKIKKKSKH